MIKNGAIGLGIGLVIGGLAALLFAPRTGKETRQMIHDKAIKVADTVKQKTTYAIDSVKEGACEASRKGQAAMNALKS